MADGDGTAATPDATTEPAGGGDGDRTMSVLGMDVVVEEAFVTFPWRAGMKRAPVAFAACFLLVAGLAAIGGFGSGRLADIVALLGIVTYNVHSIHAATGFVPELLAPVAQPILELGGLGRLVRGLFVVGVDHANPLHVVDIFAGKTDSIGHFNLAARSAGDIPLAVYYAIPPLVLAAAGYEFAASYWEEATVDSPLELVRFGIAIAAGYVVVLLVGTVVFTVAMVSPLTGQVIVFPDRYMTVIFGAVYPTVFATLGAAVVYLRRQA
jgi:hypothetical protein